MANYDMPNNSALARERRTNPEVVEEKKSTRHDVAPPKLSEGAVMKKPSIFSKVVDTFLQGRNIEDVGSYVLTNVLVPTIIDGIANTLKTAVDGICYGDTRPGTSSSYGNQKRDYGKLSRQGNSGGVVMAGGRGPQSNVQRQSVGRSRGFETIVISNRRDAEIILDHLRDIIDKYDCVSVADYYDAFDGTINVQARFTDNDWGWFNLNDVGIHHVPGGWLIELPDPVKLN